MTELIQSLKAAVARYPGTMAELARRAAIDRSTLYKILGGQRTPRREQLERLTDALELTEEEKTTLLVQYKQRGRGTDPKMRAALNQLLEAAFRVEDYTRREGNITNEAARQMSVSGQYVEGTRAVTAAAAALVAEHMLSGDTRPLLLSPFTNPVLDRVLVNRFSAPDGQTASLSQLLIFVEESDISREKAGNIDADPHAAALVSAQAQLRCPRCTVCDERTQPRYADAGVSAAAHGRLDDGPLGAERIYHHRPGGRGKPAPGVQPQVHRRSAGVKTGDRDARFYGVRAVVQQTVCRDAQVLHGALPAAVQPVCR